jgi:hypothetical protein
MLIYFLNGKLPWQGLKARTKQEKYDLIGKAKKDIPIEELCKDNPEEFALYMKYCTQLQFEEEPNYFYLKNLFYNLVQTSGFKCDWVFDWDDLPRHEQYLLQLEMPQWNASQITNLTAQQILQIIAKIESDRDKYKVQAQQYKAIIQKLNEELNMIKSQFIAFQSSYMNQLAMPPQLVRFSLF